MKGMKPSVQGDLRGWRVFQNTSKSPNDVCLAAKSLASLETKAVAKKEGEGEKEKLTKTVNALSRTQLVRFFGFSSALHGGGK